MSHALIAELQHEAQVTRTVLERIPTEKFDYTPHEKSMTFGRLASHVAEMGLWYESTLTSEELDFTTTDYEAFNAATSEELLEAFDTNIELAAGLLANASDEDLMVNWTMKNGDEVIFSMPRIQVVRAMLMNHLYHHRGQLSVYLRLNDIPVPQIYGPSADEGQPPE
ncbi:MAG: damage-inducible protein DinB [Pyrinomonadaceae bacterium]|nr:damage-inducible protein DinB [Pyrinomonadaceae bacterium]